VSTDNLDPDRVSIARRAAMMGLPSDGHLADVFGMDMVQAATSPTGYTAAQAYYALDQATEAGDFMGARNVGTMSREEAAEVFGAYVEGYREGLDVSDGDAFGGIFSKGRIKRYNKQLDRYKAARSANNQKKAAKALGRMKALWGKMSETDRQGLTSPDQLAVPGVEVAKATSAKAKKIDAKISKDDDASTDAADAESSAEDAMGALFGAAGVKEYKCRKAYVEAAMKAIAEGNLGKVNLVEMWKKVEGRKGLPSPAEIKSGAKVTLDMVIPPTSSDAMGYDGSFGAEELEVDAEVNAEEAMGALFGADGVREYKSRKAYVEAAMKAIAEGDLGKVNLVKLWKEVEGRRGLPSPAEIKAGTKVTADMAIPPSSSSMGADDSDYLNRKAYVEAAVNAVATGRLGKVNLIKLWKLVKGRAGLPSPAEIKAGAPITLSMIAPASMGYDDDFGADDPDYLNRKAYVEAAVNAVATGRLGKVNLVKLWKLVKGRAGLPSPAEIKAGAPITLSMIAPASMGYDFGADGLPDDDSDIDAVLGADDDEDMDDLGADDDEDMDELGADDDEDMDDLGADDDEDMDELGADDDEDMDELGYSVIGTRNAYRRNVKDLFQALEKGKSDKVRKNWRQIKDIYAELDENEQAQVKKPDAILASAGKLGERALQLLVYATGKTKKQILGLGKVKAKEAAAAAEAAAEAEAMGFAYGADDLPDDDSDIDAVLGADDDDDMDDLGADDEAHLGGLVLGTVKAYLRNVSDFLGARRDKDKVKLKKNWKELNDVWDKLTPKEREEVPSKGSDGDPIKPPRALLKAAVGQISRNVKVKGRWRSIQSVNQVGLDFLKDALGKSEAYILEGSKNAPVYPATYGADDLPDDDSDIDAVLGADDDDDMDDLGADDDDDMDDLGADDEDDDDFGIDEIEADLDLDMQRALVNRYSGADAPFPAGGAAPFPGPRMAGSEVF
jgi:hypothetical protein